MKTSQPEAKNKRSRAEWLIFLLLLLVALILGFFISRSGIISNIFGSGGNGGGSRGGASNTKTASPGQVKAGLGSLPQPLKAGDVKIAISDNGTYGFVTVGANDLMPGDNLARGFTLQNDGSSPISSISMQAKTSGAPVMLSNMFVTIDRCSSSACTPVVNNVALSNLGTSVIYSGKLLPGQTVSYVLHTSMATNTPSSAEGQLANVGYSLVAVGA